MIALIDGDLVAYRCSASAENEEEEIAILRADKLIRELIELTGSDHYRVFLSGSNNFRKEIDPEYKANRKDQPRPKWLEACREFLVREHKAEVTDGYEADDALAMNQAEDTIICSLDKDLLQIPGNHYQWRISGVSHGKEWVKEAQFYNVSDFDGLVHFYCSSLIGDRADNIIGVDGIGDKKAGKALSMCETERELFDTCRDLYSDDGRFFRNLKLLWLWREEGDTFDPEKRGLVQ